MKQALILFAHGARDPAWAAPLHQVRALVQARAPALHVELAFLEFMAPNLDEAVALSVAGGAERIDVVPMFIAQGGHLKRELPELVAALRLRYPAIDFVLSGPVGEVESVMQAMAEAALGCAGL